MLSAQPLKAFLFDVGGPIVDESVDNERIIGIIADILTDLTGKHVSPDEVRAERDKAIRAWSPSGNRAALWKFLKPDRGKFDSAYRELVRGFLDGIEEVALVPGVAELIPKLAANFTLALAGNQHSAIKEKLRSTGILEFFKSTEVSEDIGLEKPDTRFFLAICSRIGIPPEQCCMVGDRLDNDIYPANVLGMRTIWLKAGPHAVQEPRIPEDEPDETIESLMRIHEIIEKWRRED
ncbi:MAG TPA: HAD family hydrolase [Firmicutes bacterium]|nr:HAD family hydrolase [Bacillota bacterium]